MNSGLYALAGASATATAAACANRLELPMTKVSNRYFGFSRAGSAGCLRFDCRSSFGNGRSLRWVSRRAVRRAVAVVLDQRQVRARVAARLVGLTVVVAALLRALVVVPGLGAHHTERGRCVLGQLGIDRDGEPCLAVERGAERRR